MSSPPEEIKIICPKCKKRYKDWFRASINLTLDDFDDEYLDSATSSICPDCGHKVSHEVLIVGDDGVFEIQD